MFVRVYASSVNVGIAAPTVPPTDLALPDVSAAVTVVSLASGVTISNFDGPTGSKVAFALSPQFSAGRSYNKTFWQPPSTAGYHGADDAPYELLPGTYAAEFGTLVIGKRVFVRMTPVSSTGWNGTPVITSVLVTT